MSIDRRTLLTRGLGVAAGAATVTTTGAQAAVTEPLPLKRGMNLWPWFSLTREHPAPRTDYDWPPFQAGRPVPTAADLARLKSLGLDFVRLPLDPGPFLAATPSQRDTLLGDVMAAVRLALAQGLSVVVNPHINGATHHWNHGRLLMSADTPGFALYRALVVELAARLQRLDTSRLALEPVNEPTHVCGAREWDVMQESLLSAARGAAPALTLVATGACGSMIAGLETAEDGPAQALRAAPLHVPFLRALPLQPPGRALDDGAGLPLAQQRAVASLGRVAAADPRLGPRPHGDGSWPLGGREAGGLCGDGARPQGLFRREPRPLVHRQVPDDGASLGRARGRAHEAHHDGRVRRLAHRRPLPRRAGADRVRYIADTRRSAEALGFSWAFWNLFDGMGMMDDATRALDEDVARALGLAVP